MESFLFALTLVLVCTSTVHAAKPPVKPVSIDLSKPYNEFFQKIRSELVAGDTKLVENHVVLPPAPSQRLQPPKRWIKVDIIGQGEDRASLFFRDDNLYLMAFANKAGKVHCMKDSGSLFPQGSIALPFTESYPELTDKGGHDKISDVLKTVPLGRGEALSASNALSNYEYGRTPDRNAKRAILTFCLMIAEALRFKPIEATCTENWLRGTSHLTEVQAQYIGNWRDLSYLFCRRDPGNPWTKSKEAMQRMKIKDAKQLADTLDIVFWVNVKDCGTKKPMLMH